MGIIDILKGLSDYLLESSVKDRIAKIILFGSHAKGGAKETSDIDIMILTTNGKDIKGKILDGIYDYMIEHNVPIEVVFSDVSSIYPVTDYFTYNVLNHGVEVYSMGKLEIKREMIRSLLNLAEEYLEGAEEILDKGRIRLAIDAGYNSAELCAKALILLKEDDLPGSHGGVVSLFGQLYIKTEEMDKEAGRILNTALELRNRARYKPNLTFSRDEADLILNLARRLIKIASATI